MHVLVTILEKYNKNEKKMSDVQCFSTRVHNIYNRQHVCIYQYKEIHVWISINNCVIFHIVYSKDKIFHINVWNSNFTNLMVRQTNLVEGSRFDAAKIWRCGFLDQRDNLN